MAEKTRRSNNDGTIYYNEKRKQWIAAITWTDKQGKHHRKQFSAKKQTAAKKKLDDFRMELSVSNGNLQSDDVSFETFCMKWMAAQKIKLKPKTYMRKKQTLENQVYPYLGQIPINNITHDDIQNVIIELNDIGYSYSTIKQAFEVINCVIRAYRVENRIFFNPCEGIALPKSKEKELSDIKFWEGEQLKLIHDEAIRKFSNGKNVYRLGYGIVLLYLTGWRIGELLALEWEDVKWDKGYIVINKNSVQAVIDEEDGYKMITQKSPKTRKSNRLTPITKQIEECLLKLKEITGETKWVMSTRNGKQLVPSSVYRTFNCILRATGISNPTEDDNDSYGLHTLRHTCASLLFRSGCDTKTVSELLGHEDTKITENIYIHLIQEQRVRAMGNMDDYLQI